MRTVARGRFGVFWRMVSPSGPGQLQIDDPRKGLNTLHFYATPGDTTLIGSTYRGKLEEDLRRRRPTMRSGVG